jgi:hypothetical protein
MERRCTVSAAPGDDMNARLIDECHDKRVGAAERLLRFGKNRDDAATAHPVESDFSLGLGEERVVPTLPDVEARMHSRPALTDDDHPRPDLLTAVDLYA